MNNHHDTKSRAFRFRALYQKTGEARFLSHLDVVKAMRKAFLDAEIPITISGNSSPQPQIAFGPALPVNVESRAEFLDFFTWRYLPAEHFITQINRVIGPNLCFQDAVQISRNAGSLSSLIDGADYSADVSAISSLREIHEAAITQFQSRDEVPLTRHKSEKVIDLKKFVRSVQYDEQSQRLLIEMRIIEGSTAGAPYVIQAIYGDGHELTLVRDKLYIWINGEKRSPLTLEWEQMQIQKHLLDMTT